MGGQWVLEPLVAAQPRKEWPSAPPGLTSEADDSIESRTPWRRPFLHDLGNYGNRVSGAVPSIGVAPGKFYRISPIAAARIRKRREKDWETRRRRGILTKTAQELTSSDTVKHCGRRRQLATAWKDMDGKHRVSFDGDRAVAIVAGETGRARYRHLHRCGSPWECPSCSGRIADGRSDELRVLVKAHRAAGGDVWMLTLTIPHDAGDELEYMRRKVSKMFRQILGTRAWKRICKTVGYAGFVRALEVTHGRSSGWHPHLHVLVFVDRKLEDPATGKDLLIVEEFKRAVYDEWAKRVEKAGYRRPTYEHGISFVRSTKDEYVAKMGLADELTRGSWKKAGALRGNRTPFQILDAIATSRPGPARNRDCALWIEYASEMRGARQLTYSKGLRKRYDLRPEQTELEILDADEAAEATVISEVPAADWDLYFVNDWKARVRMLEVAELEGEEGVLRELDRMRGLPPVPF